MAEKKMTPAVLEDVRIIFRNFSGKEGTFNRKGDRNFAVILDEKTAIEMENDGWTIKYLKPREGEENDPRQAYLPVKVHYSENGRPPRVVMVTSRGKTQLDEDTVDLLDWAVISHVDLIVRPFEWEFNGKTGVSAYLNSIFATIEEDELDRKYAGLADSASNSVQKDAFSDDPALEPRW